MRMPRPLAHAADSTPAEAITPFGAPGGPSAPRVRHAGPG